MLGAEFPAAPPPKPGKPPKPPRPGKPEKGLAAPKPDPPAGASPPVKFGKLGCVEDAAVVAPLGKVGGGAAAPATP
ncbi:hypothetical protein BJX66DRAFT_313119 [Aspergillus keveii]|uniref:Uncharacterized protein n=1 Tax=Aspergillus keveii TaxID=714993 RepID=A0ABR4FSR2_9EURO